ncbi:MAG: hypothetical protein AB1418_09060 [Pseudomonadota bacterium]
MPRLKNEENDGESMMVARSMQGFRAALRVGLLMAGVSGLAGCAGLQDFLADVVVVSVEGEPMIRESSGQHHNGLPLIERMFIKRQATVNGEPLTYYVDRSDPAKIYIVRARERDCRKSNQACEDIWHFHTPAEPLHQQLLAIEAARQPAVSESTTPPPPTPSVLPDVRTTLPTVPPVPLPAQ